MVEQYERAKKLALGLELGVRSSMLDRRQFLKISAVTAVGLAAIQSRHYLTETSAPAVRGLGINEKQLLLPPHHPDTSPALTRRYPWLRYGEKSGAHLVQIANSYSFPVGTAGVAATGVLGERVVDLGGGALFLPWTPMFQRATPVYQADSALQAIAKMPRLFIKDEGSEVSALYGNKVRKYEFMLPNLAFSKVKKVFTYGAFGSNHCAHLALAARYGAYQPGGAADGMNVELALYPQEINDNVITKLRLLVASGASLRFLDGDVPVGLSICRAQLQARISDDSSAAYFPPGGSTPLTVLGHVEAVMELAEQIASGACPLTAPPDFIFVPLGSGATAMGLVLGCHLLGWPTKVVGTCSQDKNRLVRLAVNGDMDTPFLVANAAALLDKALGWLNRMGLPDGKQRALSSQQVLRQGFAYDNVSWQPEYGVVTPQVQREASAAAAAGLVVDNTFTAKSFHTLKVYAENGLLHNKSALFWNTYQRFPLNKLLPDDPNWALALPEPIRARVDAYRKLQAA